MSNSKKFLLVCEGPSDIEVLRAISLAVTNANGNSIEIVPLSPQMDQTSGIFPPHGWTAVKSWCAGNREKSVADVAHLNAQLQTVALRKNWRTLIAASGADGLIIQLDTDIAEEIRDLPQDFVASGMTRRSYTEAAIFHWLAVPASPVNSLFLVLSTYSTETWILACHHPSDPIFSDLQPNFSYEDLRDAENRLIGKGLKSRKKNGKSRLDKSPQLYKNYAAQIVSALPDIRGRCQEADLYCSFLEGV